MPTNDSLTDKLLEMKRALARQNAELEEFASSVRAFPGELAPPASFFADLDEACELAPENFTSLAMPLGIRA